MCPAGYDLILHYGMGKMKFLDRIFKLKENNTTVSREIYTGLITFLAVSYILVVNPEILGSTGMDRGGVFCVTAISAFIGTLLMAILANRPFVLAPAMGLNAFFAYSVVSSMGYSWQIALFAVVIEGIIFLLLSVSSLREYIISEIPMQLKYAMGGGIGLFITLIAFKSSYIIQDHPATLLTIRNFFGKDFHTAGISAILALAGVVFSSFLMHKKVPGALLLGILATWVAGIICQLTKVYHVDPANGFASLLPTFSVEAFTQPFSGFLDLFGSAFKVSEWKSSASGVSGYKLLLSADFAVVCLAFLFTDFFDTVGTINGAVVNTPLMQKDGSIPRLREALIVDSIATFTGGVMGTSTTTTFAESAVGINAGARTGLAALTSATLFLASLVCAPIFLAIPVFATAPALIIVGFLMMKSLVHIDWNNIAGAIPAYILVVATVFTYNVSDGLAFGIIFYTILNCKFKTRKDWLLWILTALFIAKYLCL